MTPNPNPNPTTVGPVADGLVAKGWQITHVRKLAQGISFAGPACCMLALAWLSPNQAAQSVSPVLISTLVGLMSGAFALSAWARAGLYCNHQVRSTPGHTDG